VNVLDVRSERAELRTGVRLTRTKSDTLWSPIGRMACVAFGNVASAVAAPCGFVINTMSAPSGLPARV
jgi:hypothetical protein